MPRLRSHARCPTAQRVSHNVDPTPEDAVHHSQPVVPRHVLVHRVEAAADAYVPAQDQPVAHADCCAPPQRYRERIEAAPHPRP
eukprot:6178976-Pleurochrysis_carterae.AAC.1